jgi:D,D-heptose 1,7-bisphosphate phosphatase
MTRAVFLDRDGTLVVEKNYLSDPAQVELIRGVPQALRRLEQRGFVLIIVTNQSGIGRGYYSLDAMQRVNERILAELATAGVRVLKIYYSPEAPEAPSRGRKPSPQFLFDARDEFGIDLAQSYMIGDKLIDLQCGWNAGLARCLLVRTGYGAEVEREHAGRIARAWVVDDLAAAADRILEATA